MIAKKDLLQKSMRGSTLIQSVGQPDTVDCDEPIPKHAHRCFVNPVDIIEGLCESSNLRLRDTRRYIWGMPLLLLRKPGQLFLLIRSLAVFRYCAGARHRPFSPYNILDVSRVIYQSHYRMKCPRYVVYMMLARFPKMRAGS